MSPDPSVVELLRITKTDNLDAALSVIHTWVLDGALAIVSYAQVCLLGTSPAAEYGDHIEPAEDDVEIAVNDLTDLLTWPITDPFVVIDTYRELITAHAMLGHAEPVARLTSDLANYVSTCDKLTLRPNLRQDAQDVLRQVSALVAANWDRFASPSPSPTDAT